MSEVPLDAMSVKETTCVISETFITTSTTTTNAPLTKCASARPTYKGTSRIRTPPPVGPYSSRMCRDPW